MTRRKFTRPPDPGFRFGFGGWNYAEDATNDPNYLDEAYWRGAHGGDLVKAPKGQAPRFILVAAGTLMAQILIERRSPKGG